MIIVSGNKGDEYHLFSGNVTVTEDGIVVGATKAICTGPYVTFPFVSNLSQVHPYPDGATFNELHRFNSLEEAMNWLEE